MSEALEIVGRIKALHDEPVQEYRNSRDVYFVDLTAIDMQGLLYPVRYPFPSEELAAAVIRSLRIGQEVRMIVEEYDCDYRGIGPITLVEPDFTASDVMPRTFQKPNDAPFAQHEQALLKQAIADIADRIRERFEPPQAQMDSIEARLSELSAAVAKSNKFDWSRLFVSCIVGVSVDLGFGATVPEVLVNLFKNAIAAVLEHRLLKKGESASVPDEESDTIVLGSDGD